MPNGTGMEGHAWTDSEMRDLRKRVEVLEKKVAIMQDLIKAVTELLNELRAVVGDHPS